MEPNDKAGSYHILFVLYLIEYLPALSLKISVLLHYLLKLLQVLTLEIITKQHLLHFILVDVEAFSVFKSSSTDKSLRTLEDNLLHPE